MSLKKKELVISIVLIVLFAIFCINVNVFATEGSSAPVNWQDYVNSRNDTNENYENVPTNQAPVDTNKDETVIPTNNANNNSNVSNANVNNTSGNLANTGLADAPWVIIAICVISAAFAYKKVKEYKLS